MGKRPGGATRLGSYGERVGRERAARRRAARERRRGQSDDTNRTDSFDISTPPGPQVIEIPQSDLANELSVLAALIMSGLVRSHPEARRRHREDGVSVNGAPVLSDKAKLRLSDVSPEGIIKLGLGAQQVLLRPV